MNYYFPISDAGNVVTLRAFLQQAVDHYPMLVVFSVTNGAKAIPEIRSWG